jgi:REP element-mobilizing transposase RayT
MKQQSIFKIKTLPNKFGGSLQLGKRKSQRPLSIKKPVHLVFRTEEKRHKILFSPKDKYILKLIRDSAGRYQIRIYNFALNWNHLHFVILVPSREAYKNFVRFLTSQIVAHFSKKHGKKLKGLFSLRPFTRIVSWGQDFRRVCNYVAANIYESFNYGEDMLTYSSVDWRAGPVKKERP